MSRKGPTFLKVYVIPVLMLNIAMGGWSVVGAHGLTSYLGYAAIMTSGLYLYLRYLDRFLS